MNSGISTGVAIVAESISRNEGNDDSVEERIIASDCTGGYPVGHGLIMCVMNEEMVVSVMEERIEHNGRCYNQFFSSVVLNLLKI